MARKSRRRRPQQRRPAVASTVVRAEPPAAPLDVTPATLSPAQGLDEYRYVITDLRRVGILAAAMFALLVVLSFVIR